VARSNERRKHLAVDGHDTFHLLAITAGRACPPRWNGPSDDLPAAFAVCDAEAICAAGGRPGMRFVPVKSAEQQAQAMVLKVRETLVGQRTQLANTLRGHAAEFGVVAGKGIKRIVPLLEAIEADAAIPAKAREMLALLGREIEHIDTRLVAKRPL
jgi:transposase